MFIQREIWSFYTSVSHRVINLRTQSLLKETLNAVHLRELSAWWKSEHKKCRVEKIIIISLRLLRKALEKATREEFARLVLAVHTHHPPSTPAPVFLVCEYRLYPSPRGKMFLTSGLAEDSNFPLEQLSEIWSLGRHCFQTNGFSPYMSKTDQRKQCHCFQSWSAFLDTKDLNLNISIQFLKLL